MFVKSYSKWSFRTSTIFSFLMSARDCFTATLIPYKYKMSKQKVSQNVKVNVVCAPRRTTSKFNRRRRYKPTNGMPNTIFVQPQIPKQYHFTYQQPANQTAPQAFNQASSQATSQYSVPSFATPRQTQSPQKGKAPSSSYQSPDMYGSPTKRARYSPIF